MFLYILIFLLSLHWTTTLQDDYSKERCDEWGTPVGTSGITEISQDVLCYLTVGCTLHRKLSLFSCKQFRKTLRKQKKIRSSCACHRETKNSQNPTTKKHTAVWDPHYAISCSPAKVLHQTTVSPFLLLRNFMLDGQYNCRMNICATCHKYV